MGRTTIVVNIKKGETYDEWIGKGSQWEIPPSIKGPKKEQIRKYEEWIQTQQWLMDDIPSLKGKVLGCSCKPKPCHGDVLARLADGVAEEDIVDVWEKDGSWYIRTSNVDEICVNTEDSAKLLLRLLKEKKQ